MHGNACTFRGTTELQIRVQARAPRDDVLADVCEREEEEKIMEPEQGLAN
jgi:hypothetical protein